MAQITLNFPDQMAPRVLEAFAKEFNYAETKLEGETKAQFAKRQVRDLVQTIVVKHESQAAANVAKAAQAALTAAEIDIT